jgi:DNA-binding NarL/FixJ family response regulator
MQPNAVQPIRIILADDHELVLAGLRGLLEREADLQVVATVTTGTALLELVEHTPPDVVVLDLALPPSDGLACLDAIRKLQLPVKVIILTAFGDGSTIQSAWERQADGFALKTDPPQKTITTIRNVAQGQIVFPRAIRQAGPGATSNPIDRLTHREREVLRLIAEGLPNTQIAEQLAVQESTVKYHLQNIFQKLGVSNRTEAAQIFYRATKRF